MSKHGQLQGLYPGSDLNSVDPSSITTLGSGISMEKPQKGQKPVLITLSKAIQLENRRGTVANAQRMGRKDTKPTAGTAVDTQVEVGRKGTKRKAVDIHGEVDASNIVPGKRQRKGKD
jgi:hypothetical protein